MDKLPADLIKERIKNFATQLDEQKLTVEKLKKEIREREDVGNQIIGGLKAMQELIKEFET